MKMAHLRLALALAGIGVLTLAPAAGIDGNDSFDPLLDGGAFCGPPAGGPSSALRTLCWRGRRQRRSSRSPRGPR